MIRVSRAAIALAVVVAAVAGCTTTVAGQQTPGEAAKAAADLESVLLTGPELDATMGATGMAADTTKSTLADDSAYTTPTDCLAVSSMGESRSMRGRLGVQSACRACANRATITPTSRTKP